MEEEKWKKASPEEAEKIKRLAREGKIEYAPTERITLAEWVASDFMERIFGLEEGSYVITDLSCVTDFLGMENMTLDEIYGRIQTIYGVDCSGVDYLVEIFDRIEKHETIH